MFRAIEYVSISILRHLNRVSIPNRNRALSIVEQRQRNLLASYDARPWFDKSRIINYLKPMTEHWFQIIYDT